MEHTLFAKPATGRQDNFYDPRHERGKNACFTELLNPNESQSIQKQ